MHLSLISSILAATTLVQAAPAVDTAQSIEARQADDSFGTSWNDPYIPIPRNFEVRVAGDACDFQLVYERFLADNRYDVSYVAEYPDGSSQQVRPISGSLPRDNNLFVDIIEDDERGLEISFFDNICKNGVAPRSFRANYALREGFTYENRWTTGSFGISGGNLAGAVSNIRVTSGKSSTVSWTPVAGATSYIVIMEWLVDSEVGPLPFVYARQVVGQDASSYTYARRFTRATVIANTGGDLSTGTKRFTALDQVVDVYPS